MRGSTELLGLVKRLADEIRWWEDGHACCGGASDELLNMAEKALKDGAAQARNTGEGANVSGAPLIARALLAAYWRDPDNGKIFLDAAEELELLCKGLNGEETATKSDA